MRAWSLGLALAFALPCLAEELDPDEPYEPVPVWLAHRKPAAPVITYEVHTRAVTEREGAVASTDSTTVVLDLTWGKELKKGGQRVAVKIRRYALEEGEAKGAPRFEGQEELEAARKQAVAAMEGASGEIDLGSDGKVLERRGEAAAFVEQVLFELPAGELEPGATWTTDRAYAVSPSAGAMKIKTTYTYEGIVARGERRLARLRIEKALERPKGENRDLDGYQVETRTEYEGGPRYILVDVFDGTLVAISSETIVTTSRMTYEGRTSQYTIASTWTLRRLQR